MPTSTTYRYFKSLVKAELLTSYSSGTYVLGPGICELDNAMRLHDPFINVAKPEMQQLVTAHRSTISLLTRLYKGKVMCVHREGSALTTHAYERGRPMPLDRGAASKVILAHLPKRQLRKILSNQIDPPIELDAIHDELREIRAQGYSITRGELDKGKIGISVPVYRNNQVIEGSLSLVIEDTRSGRETVLIEALIESRKRIEAKLSIGHFDASDK